MVENTAQAAPSLEDGGPAYPHLGLYRGAGGDLHPAPTQHGGMSLRAWLAGQALAGLVANPGGPIQANAMSGWSYTNCTIEQVADEACRIADAMLVSLSEAEGR